MDSDREAFDAFARTLGAVPAPVRKRPAARSAANHRERKPPLSPEYQQMVRDARAFFGDDIRAGLTEMLEPYGVSDTHALTPRQCAEISEKIQILRELAALTPSASMLPAAMPPATLPQDGTYETQSLL